MTFYLLSRLRNSLKKESTLKGKTLLLGAESNIFDRVVTPESVSIRQIEVWLIIFSCIFCFGHIIYERK